MSAAETIAPTKAIAAATPSAVENPSTNAAFVRSPPMSCAMIAPMTAIPVEPPTWRAAFSTAEPTPDLSTGTERTAAAALGVMTSDIPAPPTKSAGSRSQ